MLKSFRMFINQEAWDEETAHSNAMLTKNTKGSYTDCGEYGAKIIAERLEEYPDCYMEFGVYWFAVKDVLNRHGYYYGDTDDEEMRLEYQGKTDAHTLVAAERFKDMYRKTYFIGTTRFTLEEDGREWVLNDPEMAARI